MWQDGKSDKSLKRYYEIINRKFYFGELPKNVIVRWAEPGEEKDIACTISPGNNPRHSFVILLNHDKIATRSQKLSALLHETIHVVTQNRDCHGEAFNAWHLKLTERGAFKKGALIKGVTLF